MKRAAGIAALIVAFSAQAQDWRVSSDQAVRGFEFPESVACDAKRKVLYVGNFGGAKLDPTGKDGLGYIMKVGLDGKPMGDKQFLPGPGGEKLNKPKGIWIEGNRLWTTDIDVVWVFDLNTRKGRKFAVPGMVFGNDPAVLGRTLYVSDNRADQLWKIEPADFLNMKGEPKATSVFKDAGVNPNGLHPARDGMLYMVGFAPKEMRRLQVKEPFDAEQAANRILETSRIMI